MRKDTLFVFARAPRLGGVKRRLAREIGDRAALRFYLATLHAVVRRLARDRRFTTVLAVTPNGGHIPGLPGVARVGQGDGDLGARMARVLARHRHGRAAIVGSDIPAVTAADIRACFRALGQADACFGRAADGGYWLVGFGPRRVHHPFAAVRWSTAHALADTLANQNGRRVAMLRTLRDVDGAADLAAVAATRQP